MHTDRDPDPHVDKPPGRRFRAERKRLRLTTVDVAHACGTTESTVFNWEAGRARIPLHTMERLWGLGFNSERVIAGPAKLVSVRDVFGINQPVPDHLLRRHCLEPATAVVFHNPRRAADLMPEGEIVLLAAWVDFEEIAAKPAIVLFRDIRSDSHFLVRVSAKGKRAVLLSVGETEGRIATRDLMDRCEPTGTYCRRLGNKPAQPDGADHEKTLRAVLREGRSV